MDTDGQTGLVADDRALLGCAARIDDGTEILGDVAPLQTGRRAPLILDDQAIAGVVAVQETAQDVVEVERGPLAEIGRVGLSLVGECGGDGLAGLVLQRTAHEPGVDVHLGSGRLLGIQQQLALDEREPDDGNRRGDEQRPQGIHRGDPGA